jgi:hypothetical protein
MEILILILAIICIISVIILKTNIFQTKSLLMENMTCDRKKKDDCIYDNMVIAGNNCIYGKRDNNNLELNETIAYNINEIANLNDTDFKRYILNNAIDNSKGYLQYSAVNHINKCMKEIDTNGLNLNINGIRAQYIRLISLDQSSSDWIYNAKIQIFSKGVDITSIQINRKTISNYTSIDIGNEFEINSVKISSNKSGNSRWICALIDKNGQIVFSELFTTIPNSPISVNTQTTKIANITIPLGCYNNKSNINTYHGNNYNERSCLNRARLNNHKYFRLENNSQCYTGFSYNMDDNNTCTNENSKVYQVSSNSIDESIGIIDVLVRKGAYRPNGNMLLGYITLSNNYAINFNIKLENTKPYETQIFVVTSLTDNKPTLPGVNEPTVRSDREEFSRIPGMWLCSNTTNINYVYSTRGNYNNQISNCIRSLPLNQEVNVMIIKSGTNFKLYINTELVENIDRPEINNMVKNEGRGAIYSSYNYEGAPCVITDFMYVSSNKHITVENLNTVKNNENIVIDSKRNINYRIRTLISDEILQKLGTSANKVKLLYKGTADGFGSGTFHTLCDNKGPTLIVINANNRISGGYTSVSWASRNNYVNVDIGNAFLFTTENGRVNKYYNNIYPQYSMFDHMSYGPTFGGGHDLYISDRCNQNNYNYNNKHSYEAERSSLFGVNSFKVDDIEVYSIEPIHFEDIKNDIGNYIATNNIFQKMGANPNAVRLLYKAKRDGFGSNTFHNLCDNKGPTITFIRANNKISGGYTSQSWTSRNSYVYVDLRKAFLFTTENGQVNKYYNNIYPQYSMYDHISYGPTFGGGHDLYIYGPKDYQYNYTNKHSYDANNFILFGSQTFKFDDIEVYSTNEITENQNEKVIVYEHCNYQGRSLELGVGTYDYNFINARGFNDIISSIKVSPGLKAVAWEHNPGGGRQWTFDNDNACIVNVGANDTISSIIVSKK